MGTQNRGSGRISLISAIENKRVIAQQSTDASRSIEERRRLGQFATPNELAKSIIKQGLSLLDINESISFLEPALGTGSFLSAFLQVTNGMRISAVGIEVDDTYGNVAKELWEHYADIEIIDFTQSTPIANKHNFLVTNPPYVRHHYLSKEQKKWLQETTFSETGIRLSGLSGLYCYYMLLAHKWLAPGAICGWLIPSEFMDVNYGQTLKEYLLHKVHLLHIHRFDPKEAVFEDAIVSSSSVWFKNELLTSDYSIEFSFGGEIANPKNVCFISRSELQVEKKWTRFPSKEIRRINADGRENLADYFFIKRGIATGNNSFFIISEQKAKDLKFRRAYLQPILPAPRKLKTNIINSDNEGMPITCERFFLLNCNLEPECIQEFYPELWDYLENAEQEVATSYLCRNRKYWYFQEQRDSAPLLCTYMGRNSENGGTPFNIILNESKAIATNSYLMLYPKFELAQRIARDKQLILRVWEFLSELPSSFLEDEGRIYGGGLNKIEPSELGSVECTGLFLEKRIVICIQNLRGNLIVGRA